MDELFCFLDLETTGLDPEVCKIVEVACVLTKADFVPFARFESLVRVTIDPRCDHWEHFAWCMHHESGLLRLLNEISDNEADVGLLLHQFLAEHLGTKRANLAGNSVHFDRGFIQRAWPYVVDGFFTHRHLDVSSLRLAGAAQGKPKPEQPRAHRAMADVEASLIELEYWLNVPAVEKI